MLITKKQTIMQASHSRLYKKVLDMHYTYNSCSCIKPHDTGFVWLAQADVGIAVGSGTDVAAETADVILVNNDPKDVVQMIEFGRKTYRKMIQNLARAVGYNLIAIPFTACVLYSTFVLSSAMVAVLMSLSTVMVAINAKRLKLKFSRVSLPIFECLPF